MMKALVFLCLLITTISPLLAQPSPQLGSKDKARIITTVTELLQQNYIFPDKAAQMGAYLKERNQQNAYKHITSYQAFADTLSKDLQKAHKDLHMRVQFNPQQVEAVRRWNAAPQPSPEMLSMQLQRAKEENFGFVKVEHLPGNIGYLDFRGFYQVNEEAKNTVAAAMAFIANTNAVIVDLRKNGGGDPEMVQLIMSYFMDENPVHYNSLYDRSANTTRDFSTLAEVKGNKMPAVDLYVLTSNYTFSAAEEFTYNLKNLKRATIIGETTGGGAHPVRPFVVNDYLLINIPFARAINPFTKTNWEGTGVQPDVEISADKALIKAQMLALDKRMTQALSPQQKTVLEWQKQKLTAALHPVQLPDQLKVSYAGNYGDRMISLEGGELYYQRTGTPKRKMIPLTEDTFGLEDLDFFRLKLAKDAAGKVEKLIGLYDNGRTDESSRIH